MKKSLLILTGLIFTYVSTYVVSNWYNCGVSITKDAILLTYTASSISDLNCISMLKKQITADEHILVDRLKKGVYIAKNITPTETIERKLVKL